MTTQGCEVGEFHDEMKIGSSTTSTDNYEVRLPEEILAVVVSYVQQTSDENLRRFTLWSCCLLSRAWYSAAIQHLYEKPQLSNRNFDKFTRTICPPVNSHIRKVGLESFVRHLDMGHLAYESTRSLTARLLRRTRASLEVFIAPAISFSISSLAPLSRCGRLRSLDLSRDYYDISLDQLLTAVGSLPQLTSLSLPRSAMNKHFQLQAARDGGSSWPPKLKRLQINDWLPQSASCWAELIRSWPSSLTSIAFDDCLTWNPFYLLDQLSTPNEGVQSVSIGLRREEDGFPIAIILSVFPNLVHLAIPAPMKIPEFTTTVSAHQHTGRYLKHLEFRLLPIAVQPKSILSTRFLSTCVETFPTLVRIDVPERYLESSADESIEDLDHMEELMNTRSEGPHEDRGVFLTEV